MVKDFLTLAVVAFFLVSPSGNTHAFLICAGLGDLVCSVLRVPVRIISLLLLHCFVWHGNLLSLLLMFMLGRRPGVRFSGATLAQHVVLRLRDRKRILHGRDNSLLRVHSPHTTSTQARRTGPPRLASWGRRWCRTRSPSGCPTA